MVQESNAWWRLTPDISGSYVNGTWTPIAPLPAGYDPLYFASAVLPDGRVMVNGGEYNNGSQVESTLGAIYDPVANTWTPVAAPAGWTTIGDASSVVLANGTYMLANCCTAQAALLDAVTLTWTATGAGKADINSEEGWTLLPDTTVVTIDANNTASPEHSERYVPKSGKWVANGTTGVKLVDPGSHEIGPAVLRPDGTVFATGATANTAIYTPVAGHAGTWAVGPTFPDVVGQGQLDVADGPASLLPDGNVLTSASPGIFQPPTSFFEFDGASLTQVPATPNAVNYPSYSGRMLLLPTGQVFYTEGSKDVEVYTSSGTPNAAWAPVITSVPGNLTHGTTYTIAGTQFNGLSQANAYGDDAQAATNYPLVRIINQATHHVFYCRTHNHSSMAVATTAVVSTKFDVPAGIETGVSGLEVVANGIASAPTRVTIH